jgi:hypothetical protein
MSGGSCPNQRARASGFSSRATLIKSPDRVGRLITGQANPADGHLSRLSVASAEFAPKRKGRVVGELWRTSLQRIQTRFLNAVNQGFRLKGYLIQSAIPRGSSGPPELPDEHEALVALGSGASCSAKQWLKADGNPIGIEPGFRRLHRFYSQVRDSFGQYKPIADDAGIAIQGVPAEVWQVLWKQLPIDSQLQNASESVWTDALFELAWQRIPGAPLSADKFAWIENTSVELDALEALGSRDPQFVPVGIKSPPDHWYSKIEDLFTASVAAIDILLAISDAAPDAGATLPNGAGQCEDNTASASSVESLTTQLGGRNMPDDFLHRAQVLAITFRGYSVDLSDAAQHLRDDEIREVFMERPRITDDGMARHLTKEWGESVTAEQVKIARTQPGRFQLVYDRAQRVRSDLVDILSKLCAASKALSPGAPERNLFPMIEAIKPLIDEPFDESSLTDRSAEARTWSAKLSPEVEAVAKQRSQIPFDRTLPVETKHNEQRSEAQTPRAKNTGIEAVLARDASVEFSVNTVDLPHLLSLVTAVLQALEAYEVWIAQHAHQSIATAELLAEAILSANSDLRDHLDFLWRQYGKSGSVQSGLFGIVNSLREASARIYANIPNDPNVERDDPRFIRLSENVPPVRFGKLTTEQLELARVSLQSWIEEAASNASIPPSKVLSTNVPPTALDAEARGTESKQGPKRRPTYERNWLWLKWAMEIGLDSGKVFSRVRDRWNALSEKERRKYGPHYQVLPKGTAGWDRVRKGIKTAEIDQATESES